MYRRVSILFFYLLPFIGFSQNHPEPLVYHIPEMDAVSVKENNIYARLNDTTLTFTIYYPKNMEPGKPLPTVIFNNGVGAMDIPQWGQYKDWGRLIAASDMIAITYQARPRNALPDGEALIDYLNAHAKELNIDNSAIGLWTCSANTPVGLRLAFKTRPQIIKALVIYYGVIDSLGDLRQDLPTLLVRAGLDVQNINTKMEEFLRSALEQDIRIEFINYLKGVHAFDLFTDTDESRDVIKHTVAFLKRNLARPVTNHDFILTNRNFMRLINIGESQKAMNEIKKARDNYFSDSNYNSFFNGVLKEQVLNTNAYWLLDHDKQKNALEIFKFVAETYPESPNAYDGLADAFEAVGNNEEAIKNSEIALKKLAKATNSSQQFKEAIRNSAEERIKRLKK